jgi:hypothetical protein
VTSSGRSWEPLDGSAPSRRRRATSDVDALRPYRVSPFTKLARTHALMAAGDTMVAIALAGSLFFDIDPSSARSKVALYLLFTMAPFAVVAPLVGPALDRMPGGRRLVVVLAGAGRAGVATLMAFQLDTLLLFPLAFVFLVLSKTYAVSKSALVPTVVGSAEELVEANSKLGLLSGVVGVVAAIPALLFKLLGPGGPLGLAAVAFAIGTVLALRLPRAVVAADDAGGAELEELRSAGVVLAASAMGLVRATVGFLTFMIAFWFRGDEIATIWFGAVLLMSAVGSLIGNVLGPPARAAVKREEAMLVLALAIVGAAGLFAALTGGLLLACLLAGAVGLSAALARLAFDAIVQRDAPDANRGRAFAQFETRFQLAWVIAAFVPVVIPIPPSLGFAIVGGLAVFAGVSYVVGTRRIRAGRPVPPPLSTRAVGRVRQGVASRRTRRGAAPPERMGPADAPSPAGPVRDSRFPGQRERPLPPPVSPPLRPPSQPPPPDPGMAGR